MVTVLDEQEVRRGLHRLGNVLGVILVHADGLLRESSLADDRARDALRSIADAAGRARDELRDLYRACGIPQPSAPPRDPAPSVPAGAGAGAATRASLLLIEDNAEVRTAFASVLTRAGYDVEAAASGFEGIKRYQRRRFDCVVTDLDLPGINGLTVSRAIKDRDPEAWVVLLTGGGVELEPAAISAAGIDRLETKPLGYAQILGLGVRPERTP